MNPRKKQKAKPTLLPKDVLQSVGNLFSTQFQKEKSGADFLVYAQMYVDELLFCVSLADPKSLRAGTIYLSCDLPKGISEKPEQVTQRLEAMVDIAASWFSQTFAEAKQGGLQVVLDAMAEMPNAWQDFSWEKAKYFVKLNRDNPVLEKEADKFLEKAGHTDSDFDDDALARGDSSDEADELGLSEEDEAELEKMVDEIMEEDLDEDDAVTNIELGTAGIKRKKPPLQ